MRLNDVDRLIQRMEAEPSEDLDRRIQTLLDAQPTAMPASGWRRAVRSRTARFGVAAAVLLAVALSLPFFNGDRSNVWAQALEDASKIRNYSYRVVITQKAPGPPEMETVIENAVYYISVGYAVVIENYVKGELECRSYYRRDSNDVVAIYPATKEYERRPRVAYHDETPGEMAKWVLTGNYVELGEKTVDGRVLVGLTLRRAPSGLPEYITNWHQEIWFDRETKLPVAGQTSGTDTRSGVSWVTRQDQYRFGVEFPAHFFEPKISADYTIRAR